MPLTNQGVDGPICTTQAMLIPNVLSDLRRHSCINGEQSVQHGKPVIPCGTSLAPQPLPHSGAPAGCRCG